MPERRPPPKPGEASPQRGVGSMGDPRWLDRAIKDIYQGVVEEPLPDELQRLAGKLAEKD